MEGNTKVNLIQSVNFESLRTNQANNDLGTKVPLEWGALYGGGGGKAPIVIILKDIANNMATRLLLVDYAMFPHSSNTTKFYKHLSTIVSQCISQGDK